MGKEVHCGGQQAQAADTAERWKGRLVGKAFAGLRRSRDGHAAPPGRRATFYPCFLTIPCARRRLMSRLGSSTNKRLLGGGEVPLADGRARDRNGDPGVPYDQLDGLGICLQLGHVWGGCAARVRTGIFLCAGFCGQ